MSTEAMPPLPEQAATTVGLGRVYTAEQMHAYARTYAADLERRLQEAGRWISVEERMPPKNEEVLIAFRDVPLPATGQYTASPHDTWGWCFPRENDPEETGPITHWQPLPPPPSAAAAAGKEKE